jgi:adenylate kinase family enzyme
MATAKERKKLQAEQYLAENKVHSLLEQVTAELLRFYPNDPLEFIVQRVQQLQENPGSTEHRPRLIAVLGGPASGKAVQTANLSQELGVISIAPPELIRDEIKNGTDVGRQVGEMLHANVIVPKEIVTELVKQRISHQEKSGNKDEVSFALDGYPRTIDQALHFERNVAEVTIAVYLECEESTLRQRMSERAEINGQEDDREPMVSEKIRSFQEETLPVVEYYRGLGKLVTVNADRPMAEVMKDVAKAVR